MVRVPFAEACDRLTNVFGREGVPKDDATTLADILATNSLEGVPSHGLHFFDFILSGLREGRISPQARPSLTAAFGAWEQWDGNQGPGPLNALRATNRAMELAAEHGIGMVALRNTNHWTRAGFYGQWAARAGFGFICWTNTSAVMPPWGSLQPRLGNNPMVFALPHADCPLVMDMALAQFSIGRLRTTQLQGEMLPVPGGYDEQGNLTRDPTAILHSGRVLPIGYWKGSGMALLLDLLAATLAGGNTTLDSTEDRAVDSVSQVYIAFDLGNRLDLHAIGAVTDRVLEDLRQTWAESGDDGFHFPGQGASQRRESNLLDGVPVDRAVWRRIILESPAA
jgi:3-dehydro-L-gulonate 2-dehydrogenase